MRETYRFEITPKDKNKLLDIKQLHEYRDLIYLLVKRDFIASYKQTRLGILWAVLNPLLTTVAYILIFGNLAKLTTADISGQEKIPGFVFYLSGSILWGYFSGTFSGVSGSLRGNARILGKVYFPRIVIPFSVAFSKMISFVIQFCMLMAALIYYAIRGTYVFSFSLKLVWIPFLLLQIMFLSMGLGMIVASLTTYYRDLGQIMSFIMRVWQYGTPIAYGLTLIPGRFRRIYLINPVTPIVTSFRRCMFLDGYFNIKVTALSIIVTIAVYLVGRYMYGRIEKNFMDTI